MATCYAAVNLLNEWMDPRHIRTEAFGADVSQSGNMLQVHWPSESGLAAWFFTDTVMHELGHHFGEQYKKKRRLTKGRRFEEMNAELHAFRLTRAMVRRKQKALQ